MNSATTHRLRGRAGRRIAAAVLAAAALGLGTTACGQDTGNAGSPGSSGAAGAGRDSASHQASSGGSSSDAAGPQGQDGGSSATGSSAGRGSSAGGGSKAGGDTGGGSASAGGGVAHAGSHRTVVGTLKYLAPGKLTVTPRGGGREQAFLVSQATRVLGAAAICSDADGDVAIGGDGFGTRKCTVEQLEKAARTGSVTVRVTMDAKSGGGETVEEKYHP